MHHVERAIILAAGEGTRLQPLTLHTPKPLIKAGGTCMIDTAVAALNANGIEEIHVVVGYRSRQFSAWANQRHGIHLIENPHYASTNNISSLYCAREYIDHAFILDGDQIVRNPVILNPDFTRSFYLAAWTDMPTGEWLLRVENGQIVSCSRTGGSSGYRLFSISAWTPEDAAKLRTHLELAYDKQRLTNLFWDDIALFLYPAQYALGIRRIAAGDLIEIDTPDELYAYESSITEGAEIK